MSIGLLRDEIVRAYGTNGKSLLSLGRTSSSGQLAAPGRPSAGKKASKAYIRIEGSSAAKSKLKKAFQSGSPVDYISQRGITFLCPSPSVYCSKRRKTFPLKHVRQGLIRLNFIIITSGEFKQ
jgi:hypothetical protein